jgi:hypothetical protein
MTPSRGYQLHLSRGDFVLKEEGFCYFSAGNKYMVIEGHDGLPFLSWIPKSLLHFYLKVTEEGDFYYEAHRSLRG